MSLLPMNRGAYGQPSVYGSSPDYGAPEMQDIQKQRALAERLRQQGEEQLQGQMVSGRYVAPSWTQVLSKALQQGLGAYQLQQADDAEKAYSSKKAKAYADILNGNKPQQIAGEPTTTTTIPAYTPEQQDRFGSPLPDVQRTPVETTQQNFTTETPEQVADRQRAQVYDYVQKYGASPEAQLLLSDFNHQRDRGEQLGDRNVQWQREDTNHARDVGERREDIQGAQEFQRVMQKEQQGFALTQQERQFAQAWKMQNSSQNFTAGQNALSRAQAVKLAGANDAPVSVLGADGKPMYVTRQQALGMRPYSAADDAKAIAATAKEEGKKEGAGIVDSNISLLRNAYGELNANNGIVSSNKGFGSNLDSKASSSALGQMIGGAFGTKNQTQRDMIEQTRPLLLQSIMKATGMSAKQMDSNAELKLWLSTATDPTKSYEANMQALDNIERTYGSGAGKPSITNPNAAPQGNGWGIEVVQ